MWVINSLQNEIRECYVHDGIDGYGRDHGYGIFLDLHSSNNLVEDNILSRIDGGRHHDRRRRIGQRASPTTTCTRSCSTIPGG